MRYARPSTSAVLSAGLNGLPADTRILAPSIANARDHVTLTQRADMVTRSEEIRAENSHARAVRFRIPVYHTRTRHHLGFVTVRS